MGGAGESGLGGEGATEEGVLESLVWLHSGVGVVVQHLEDEGFKLAVVLGGVAWFPLANAPRTPSVHS